MTSHFVQVREHVARNREQTGVATVSSVRDASLFAFILDNGNHLRVQVVRTSREEVVLDLQVESTGKEAPETVAPGRRRFDLPRAPIILGRLAQVHGRERF